MTRRRHVAQIALTFALIAGTSQSQESMPPPAEPERPTRAERAGLDERAFDILTSAQEALAETKDIGLTIRSEIHAESGPLAAFKLGADGNAWLRQEEGGQWTRSMVGTADEIGAGGQLSFTVVKSGSKASWIDPENQEVIHAVGHYAKGKYYSSVDLLGLHYLFQVTPYARELGSTKLEVLGTEAVDNTLCNIVRVEYSGRELPRRWYISATDGFPRRIVEELMEGATRTYDFTNVQIDGGIDESRFSIAVPSTYVEKNLPDNQAAQTTAPQQEAATNPMGQFGVEIGDLGAPFTASDIFGEEYDLKDYAGKPVVLFFWASWVPSTALVANEIIEINDYLGEDGKLLSFALRERTPETAVNLMLEEEREDVVVLTSGGRAGNVYNIAKLPSIVILDSDGKIAYRNEHYAIEDTINDIKAKLDELR
jgi:hypothetical protein